MMARITLGDEAELRGRIERNGFVRASEPAAGSGSMVIALAREMREMGINYQQHLHVTAVDVDAKCVHMAYAQFALLNIPAVVVHGNSLTLEDYSQWHTPAHILGGWRWKLARAAELEAGEERHTVQTVTPTVSAHSSGDDGAPPAAQLTLF